MSFSSTVKKSEGNSDVFPKKCQAVVIPIIENVSNEDYLISISEFVSPSKVRFISRMSNNRLCVYLDSKETVDKFLENHSELTIKKKLVKIRRLINPVRRIVISNVCPIIPHSVIESELIDKIGLKLSSPVSFVKAGFSNSDFEHIYSFKRSVYYTIENDKEIDSVYIPESITIKYEDEEYRVFLSTEKNLMCFSCKKNGHLAKNCPSSHIQTSNKRLRPSTGSDSTDAADHSTMELQRNLDLSTDYINESKNVDRNLEIEINAAKKSKGIKTYRPVPNMTKTDTPDSAYSGEDLTIIKLGFKFLTENNTVKTSLKEDQFVNLLLTVRNSSDKIGETKKVTKDIPSLIKLIEDIKIQVGRYTRNSLISYVKHLKREIRTEEKDSNSSRLNVGISH